MKISIESFAEDQYDISMATHQKADVDSFIKNLRGEQIQLVLNQGETIIMCSEFADLPATLKCEDFGIFFWDKTFKGLGTHFYHARFRASLTDEGEDSGSFRSGRVW